MKDKNNIDKIDYYKYLLKDLDSDLLSLIKERIALSKEYNSYIFKNNLENKKKLINSFSEVNLNHEDYELKEIFKLLDNMSNKSYRNLSKKYRADYAYISDKRDDFLEFIFYQILGQKIEHFDVENFNELFSILNRDNFKGYILKDSCGYKLIDHLTDSTDQTKEIGQINLVQKFNKKNYGFNTEYVGLLKFLQKEAIDLKDKTVAVLYKKDVNKSIDYALNKCGVEKIDHIDIDDFKDYQVYYNQVLINTVDLEEKQKYKDFSLKNFDKLELVLDFSSNNFYTRLSIDAKDKNIKSFNSLYKNLYQDKKSIEILTKKKISDYELEDILSQYIRNNLNIVLVGMPGAGKTTIGRKLGKLLNRKHFDLDRQFYLEYGISPQDYLNNKDEESFRQKEKLVVEKLGDLKGVVISTSGGAVSKIENYYPLKRNSIIFMVERDLSYLSTRNRPLSQGGMDTLVKMRDNRKNNYEYFTDFTVENKGDFNGVAYEIVNIFEELF
ncbi:shikimate kinase [Helcococcus massiliensis]|uniref:shikimate kinase n=1 Tax=Helcococcus massiliensis TaxID=2040290 RepID=UPI000CDF1706|nr:shikimate kinase [Helcococcus massiliensis]